MVRRALEAAGGAFAPLVLRIAPVRVVGAKNIPTAGPALLWDLLSTTS